jgi:hypothetical protein
MPLAPVIGHHDFAVTNPDFAATGEAENATSDAATNIKILISAPCILK